MRLTAVIIITYNIDYIYLYIFLSSYIYVKRNIIKILLFLFYISHNILLENYYNIFK